MCAYYDLGGEGVAYHDSDPQNHGSGELNPADGTYLNEFRIHEGVDTSYTKFQRKPDPIDDNPFNKVVLPAELLYVGWTEPGEWFSITVNVTHSGTYAADCLYTSNRGGAISVDVNGKDATGPLQIASTNDPADPLAWRQWHHWNLASQLFQSSAQQREEFPYRSHLDERQHEPGLFRLQKGPRITEAVRPSLLTRKLAHFT